MAGRGDRGRWRGEYGVGDRPGVGAERRPRRSTIREALRAARQAVGRLSRPGVLGDTSTVAKFCRQGRSTSVTAAASSSTSRAVTVGTMVPTSRRDEQARPDLLPALCHEQPCCRGRRAPAWAERPSSGPGQTCICPCRIPHPCTWLGDQRDGYSKAHREGSRTLSLRLHCLVFTGCSAGWRFSAAPQRPRTSSC